MDSVTGAGLKDWVIIVAGNIFIVLFVVRTLGAFAKKEWGEMIVNVLVGVFVAGLVYSTDSTITILKNLWSLISGGS